MPRPKPTPGSRWLGHFKHVGKLVGQVFDRPVEQWPFHHRKAAAANLRALRDAIDEGLAELEPAEVRP